MSKKLIYVAGPLFNSHERAYLEEISQTLEKHGYATYLPHRDAGVITDWNDHNRKLVFDLDLAALNQCHACVALLTGADHDSGTCVELGYLYRLGKPCIGITDDGRSNTLNNMVWGICGNGQQVCQHLDSLIPLVDKLFAMP